MVKPGYVPAAGDLIWIDFDPQVGREQSGRRPALVLSRGLYNRKTGLMICCPITSQIRGYASEIGMPPASAKSGGIKGAVLADHVKSMSWIQRRAEYARAAAAELIGELKFTFAGLLEIPE